MTGGLVRGSVGQPDEKLRLIQGRGARHKIMSRLESAIDESRI